MASGLNTVNVYSIDEERLRFRVIVAIDTEGFYDAQGNYDIDIPIPTSFANSHEYSSCRIRCDTFTGVIRTAAQSANGIWTTPIGGQLRNGCVELQLSTPSSQTTLTSIDAVANAVGGFNQPNVETGGFKQLIPLQYVAVGGLGAGWNPAVASSGGWLGVGGVRQSEAIICANPFGSRMRIRLVDPFTRNACFLADQAAAPGVDLGRYCFQFEIEMVADK
jgi:hypothetical protein